MPARPIVVHLVRRPVAREEAAGLVPAALVAPSRRAGDADVMRRGGRIVKAPGGAVMPWQVAAFQPTLAGAHGPHLAVIPGAVWRQMRRAMLGHRRHQRHVRRGERGRELLGLHSEPSWQPRQGW